jgi:hypothetical protein
VIFFIFFMVTSVTAAIVSYHGFARAKLLMSYENVRIGRYQDARTQGWVFGIIAWLAVLVGLACLVGVINLT